MRPHILKEMLSEEEIQKRVKELGKQISADYADKNVLAVGVLKGSVIFMADLVREMEGSNVEIGFLAVSSYEGTDSSGSVRLLFDLDRPLEDTHVLIVEDILDTGNTLSYLTNMLSLRNPASMKLVALLDKPERRKAQINLDYRGFQIPDRFVVGYGLDYDGYYRNLKNICTVEFTD
ncbi:hypoxanthine phosphoribosyltransferase [Seleniivibrio woodruffii]|uniref:Hypoxanthine phosphoribosyltransferase n=1 Tax=Seleniivibrio woodruffii TaxID=1078050 RepID=A0A4R1KA05_9BACT|nr:hypoxanthine phosphoribosyltransferase [Seleniivibrio woodruffii]TCK60867.1 hypoxanthine phosphoribosyltransferase [Seleniivibrio woodruffii]TVZ36497.1 hypoxanthine phosphoribosyltransferase [Seleniivibrio woodruffii]